MSEASDRKKPKAATLTAAQFEVLAKLTRAREAPMMAAALVLLEGVAPAEAARQAGLSRQSVSNSVSRYRGFDKAVRAAYCVKK